MTFLGEIEYVCYLHKVLSFICGFLKGDKQDFWNKLTELCNQVDVVHRNLTLEWLLLFHFSTTNSLISVLNINKCEICETLHVPFNHLLANTCWKISWKRCLFQNFNSLTSAWNLKFQVQIHLKDMFVKTWISVKSTVYPKINILSSFAHPHIVLNPRGFLSFVERKKCTMLLLWFIQWTEIGTFKLQERQKNISSCMFHVRKKAIQVLNNMRLSK